MSDYTRPEIKKKRKKKKKISSSGGGSYNSSSIRGCRITRYDRHNNNNNNNNVQRNIVRRSIQHLISSFCFFFFYLLTRDDSIWLPSPISPNYLHTETRRFRRFRERRVSDPNSEYESYRTRSWEILRGTKKKNNWWKQTIIFFSFNSSIILTIFLTVSFIELSRQSRTF